MYNSTLCHIEKDGKYLMLHRVKKKNDMNHDKWIAIGGKLERGESPEEANIREVFEETGLTLGKTRYCGIVTFVCEPYDTEYMHLFHTTDFSGDLIECDEGNLEWVEKEKILELPIWEGDKIFLKLIDENVPFFSLKLVYEGDKLKTAILNGEVIK